MGDSQNTFENKEGLAGAETISAHALIDLIYKGSGSPQDERFLPTEDGGVFRYFNLADAIHNKENKFYSLIKVDDKVIGLCELEKSPFQEKTFWIKFLSIDPEYQNQGYASRLAEEVFRFAKQEDVALETSSYTTKEGYEKLKPLFIRLAKDFSVNFIDKEKR